MKYKFKFASALPKNKNLLADLEAASARLAAKLEKVDINSLPISDYNKRYFGSLVKGITAGLQLRSYILSWTLHEINIPKEKIVLIDYGGGSGMLSLLAKEYGIGTVIYDDIYPVSCDDARTIAREIGLEAEHYVPADIDDLIVYLKERGLVATAIASYDVLEHIYDVEAFLPKLSALGNGSLTVMMGSGANPLNPYVNKVLVKKQIEFELQDRPAVWGSKNRDSLKSFLSLRKEIIAEYLAAKNITLPAEKIHELAVRVRGQMTDDIYKSVDKFISTGEMPQELKHKTNTCDPLTGNWAEHLMNPYELADVMRQEGYQTRVLPGYYGDSNNNIKKLIGRSLNFMISLLGKKALTVAGFYALYGVRKQEKN